jgi:diaminobutyrate-2-oxoglutarate transaminase
VIETAVFQELESEVRSYCRRWPVVFDRATGSWLYDEHGEPYLDFFSGAGALNYGHNNPVLKRALIDYLLSDRVVHSLDMFTVSKREFLATLDELLLKPRGLEYRVQFPGPAGTNAVEAALKLARKVTGRTTGVCFTNAFHGVSLGSLAVTANPVHRGAAGVPLEHSVRLPFNDLLSFELLLSETAATAELPAAVIVETVQGEGGINVADDEWLRAVGARCTELEIPLIVDDVQMGCGRTGPFFSFEHARITPDIVCLSKSISGYGLPLALTLIRPELDIWRPGEHNGTFRGFNPALVTATAALRHYWTDDALERGAREKGRHVADALGTLARSLPELRMSVRGRGLAQGLAFESPALAQRVGAAALERGLIVETAGPDDEVIKLLPALTVTDEELNRGLALLADAVLAVC